MNDATITLPDLLHAPRLRSDIRQVAAWIMPSGTVEQCEGCGREFSGRGYIADPDGFANVHCSEDCATDDAEWLAEANGVDRIGLTGKRTGQVVLETPDRVPSPSAASARKYVNIRSGNVLHGIYSRDEALDLIDALTSYVEEYK